MLIALLIIPVIFTIGSVMIGYPYYKSSLATGNVVELEIDEEVDQKNANILIRLFYTFPRAWHVFKQSPLLGTGVGSYDDRPFNFQEVVPYIEYNAQPSKSHTDAHAHHSYLHMLAEQGIIGLTLFLIFWTSIFLYLRRLKVHPVLRDYLIIAFFTITFAAFTEHRITTPSMMLPFTISLGMLLMHRDNAKRVRVVEVKDG
jgi:O-antigen ligase